jgi:hypothetical protein
MKKITDEDGDLKTGAPWTGMWRPAAARSLAPPPRAHAAAVKYMDEVDRAAAAAGGEADNASPGSTPPLTPEWVAGQASFAA